MLWWSVRWSDELADGTGGPQEERTRSLSAVITPQPRPEPALLPVLRTGVYTDSRHPLVIGSRRSFPKPFAEIFVPGGYCRRLYSAVSTIRSTRVTSSAS